MRQFLLISFSLVFITGCSSAGQKTAFTESGSREIASTPPVGPSIRSSSISSAANSKARSARVVALNCRAAARKGFKSPSIADLETAAGICHQVTEAACISYVNQNSDGAETGDGRLIASVCELRAAYGANKQVSADGKASPRCETAHHSGTISGTRSDVEDAVATCFYETQAACVQKVATQSDGPETGDGRWMAASCELSSALGSYLEVMK